MILSGVVKSRVNTPMVRSIFKKIYDGYQQHWHLKNKAMKNDQSVDWFIGI